MLVNLSEVMNRKEKQELEVTVGFDRFELNTESYPVHQKNPVKLTLQSPAAKQVLIKLETSLVLLVPCDRCLKDVEVPFSIFFEDEIDFTNAAEERTEDLDETCYITGYDLDVDELIREEVLLVFPGKILCREDCKGICKVCGADLNLGECGCDRTVLDPRMAAIRDIFKNFKEV